jgi:hypothetical protein
VNLQICEQRQLVQVGLSLVGDVSQLPFEHTLRSLVTLSHVSAECLFFNFAMPPLRLRFASSQCCVIRRMLKMIRFWNQLDVDPMNSPLNISLFLFYFLFSVAMLLHQFSGSDPHPVLQFHITAFLFHLPVLGIYSFLFCKNLRILGTQFFHFWQPFCSSVNAYFAALCKKISFQCASKNFL